MDRRDSNSVALATIPGVQPLIPHPENEESSVSVPTVQGSASNEFKLAPSPNISAMKARTEANSETAYVNESFDGYMSSSKGFQCTVNGDSAKREPTESTSKGPNNFSNNNLTPKKLCSDSCNCGAIPHHPLPEKGFYPLHFNTNEALDKTPAIFKSLNSGGRGPDTFVFNSSLKPTFLPWNDDPCKTFVITSDKWESVEGKNKTVAVNGGQILNSEGKSEYLSYVIKKTDVRDSENMNEESSSRDSDEAEHLRTPQGVDETDKASTCCKNVVLIESEICDNKVQCGNEKTAEDVVDLSFDRTITGKKEQTFARLQEELEKAHQELKLKDEEVTRLTQIREDVERELEELTASLFQEAHKMVSKAKEKQVAAEKSLKESQMKVDVLTAEVLALKTLVLTSTPSRPNPHLHPQIGKEENSGGVNLFNKKHRRSPSHFNLKYGRENSPPESPVRDEQSLVQNNVAATLESRDISEVDPVVHKEFMNWTLNCKLDKTDPFIDRIYREDINLCLDFSNRELAEEVQKAIETRNIFIEAVTDKSKTIFPRKCALLEVTRQCHYRMKLGDQDIWYNISQMCRNRIIAVCDFINYLRYIELGLVKSSVHDMFWEIMRFRKEMVLARLGLSMPPP